MSSTVRLLTAEDLWNMPDHGGRHELVKGELRVMTPAGFDHGTVVMNLGAELRQYAKAHDLGVVVAAETGFLIARNPDTLLAPDVAFVKKDRIPASGRPLKYWPGAPDLAVEVVSPSDTLYEVSDKVQAWLNAGTLLVWVVNPRQKTVMVYRTESEIRIVSLGESLTGDDIIPGFALPVADIFA